jgi:hypothetical protein
MRLGPYEAGTCPKHMLFYTLVRIGDFAPSFDTQNLLGFDSYLEIGYKN